LKTADDYQKIKGTGRTYDPESTYELRHIILHLRPGANICRETHNPAVFFFTAMIGPVETF